MGTDRSCVGIAELPLESPILTTCFVTFFRLRVLRVRSSRAYSKMRIAAAITVVQRPCLSPTADWVMFAVRTILFEI